MDTLYGNNQAEIGIKLPYFSQAKQGNQQYPNFALGEVVSMLANLTRNLNNLIVELNTTDQDKIRELALSSDLQLMFVEVVATRNLNRVSLDLIVNFTNPAMEIISGAVSPGGKKLLSHCEKEALRHHTRLTVNDSSARYDILQRSNSGNNGFLIQIVNGQLNVNIPNPESETYLQPYTLSANGNIYSSFGLTSTLQQVILLVALSLFWDKFLKQTYIEKK
ncbi:MAG: hypothetical protein H6779_03755 [Candidatus Nomurabacteria bacterium]|nr:MAG: hypothetical protein H6779_03755 [Candidatus Nomurabacteria bacterium]